MRRRQGPRRGPTETPTNLDPPARNGTPASDGTTPAPDATADPPAGRGDQVERLLRIIREALIAADGDRLVRTDGDRWWLAGRADRDAAAVPLADRVEWAVYSLLSTAGPLSEAAFFERMASLFTGADLPDEALVRACLDSYRSLASTRIGCSPGTTSCAAPTSTTSCWAWSLTSATGWGYRCGSASASNGAGSMAARSAPVSPSRNVPGRRISATSGRRTSRRSTRCGTSAGG